MAPEPRTPASQGRWPRMTTFTDCSPGLGFPLRHAAEIAGEFLPFAAVGGRRESL